MNKKVLTLLGSVALLLVIGTLSAAVVFAGHFGSTTKGTVRVHDAQPGGTPIVKGANATLKMNVEGDFTAGFHVSINTKGLDPDNIYSMWWELLDTDNGTTKSIMWADGGIAGSHGQLTLESWFPAGNALPAKNSVTTLKDEVATLSLVDKLNVVLLDHGEEQFPLRGAQMGTRPGGCISPGGFPGLNGTFACLPAQLITFP